MLLGFLIICSGWSCRRCDSICCCCDSICWLATSLFCISLPTAEPVTN